MLRSLIAYVSFLFAAITMTLSAAQSARAEMPLEFTLWLNVAADSLDHQIGHEMEVQRKTLNSVVQRTADGFGRVMNQCRMGVGGKRGLQLVRVIDLCVELGDSGVAGVVAPVKNWNFPAENFEFRQCRVVQGNVETQHSPKLEAASPIVENFYAALGHGHLGQKWFHNSLDRLATRAREEMDRLEEAVYRPAEPLVQAASRAWRKLMAESADQDRAEVDVCVEENPEKGTLSAISRTFEFGMLINYWLDMSHSALAKLNWLTSKVRHIAEACMKSVEPQFLILKFDPLA